jgi:hypothetical protein
MKLKHVVTVAALFAILPLSFATAQNQLPTTTVRPPKPPIGAPDSHLAAEQAQQHFTRDPSVPYTTPGPVQPNDWNAPAVMNLRDLSDAQFAQFQAAHPTAVIINRCYVGQDPSLHVRSQMRKAYGGLKNCAG